MKKKKEAKKFQVNPWMKGIVTTFVCRNRVHFKPGQKVMCHYSPAKYSDDGQLVRPEGYIVVVGTYKIGEPPKQVEKAKMRFLFLDEVNAVLTGEQPEDRKVFKALDYSTFMEWTEMDGYAAG